MYVADARAAIDRFGPRFAQIYGQGEGPMTITTLSKQRSPTAIIRAGPSGWAPPAGPSAASK